MKQWGNMWNERIRTSRAKVLRTRLEPPVPLKITEVKQFGPWLLVSTWMGDHSSVEVDAEV